jgi:uncharacterized membrane protein
MVSPIKRLLASFALTIVFVMNIVMPACAAPASSDTRGGDNTIKVEESFVVGKVKSVTAASLDERLMQKTGIVSHHQLVEVEITEGPLAGKTVVIPNEVTDNPAYNILPKPGSELVIAVIGQSGSKPEIDIADYHRAPIIMWLLGLFLVLFLVCGGKKGLKSLLGLIVCIALVAFVLLPASMSGANPLLVASLICVVATCSTMLFVAGFSKKALAAIGGTVGGVIVSGIAAQTVIVLAPLTGLTSEEAQILRGSVLSQPPEFYSGLLAAGMLIGALGVIMDVGISVASSVSEVSITARNLSTKALYDAGMNVGRDIMGTMTTTLVLAYAGGAMPLLMLVSMMPSTKLLNLDLVATEVTAALSGSLGLVCTIPLTAFFAARLMASTRVRRNRPASADTMFIAGVPLPEDFEIESPALAAAKVAPEFKELIK